MFGVGASLNTHLKYVIVDVENAHCQCVASTPQRETSDRCVFYVEIERVLRQWETEMSLVDKTQTRNDTIAMLRMDGDIYSSTNVVLRCLCLHVSTGGWIVVDDYDWTDGKNHSGRPLYPRRMTVDRYRLIHRVTEPLKRAIEGKYTPVSWVKNNTISAVRNSECKIGDYFGASF